MEGVSRRVRRGACIVACVAVGLFLIGIAGAQAQAVRGVTDKEVLIGTYTDLSGVTAMWGVNNSNALRMAFDEQNAKGGVNGRTIRYVVEDNQYQVPRSVQAANKLINRDGVFLMVANGGTPMNNATMPEQLAKGVPNMFPLTSARSMYEPFHRLKFGLAASYYDQMRAGVKYFTEKKGLKRVCAMYQDSDFGRDVMDGVRAQLKAENLELVSETTHKPTDMDFSASVTKLREANCDLVILGTISRDTNQIVAAVRKAGWKPTLLGSAAAYDNATADLPGNANEGLYAVPPVLFVGVDDPRPTVKEFVARYRDRFGRDPNFAAQVGWTAGQLIIEGLKRAGRDLTVDTFVAGMESIRGYEDIFGSPKMSFGPDRRQGSNESFLAVVHDQRWVPALEMAIAY